MKGVSSEIKSARGLCSWCVRHGDQDSMLSRGTHKQIDGLRFGRGRDRQALRGLPLLVALARTITRKKSEKYEQVREHAALGCQQQLPSPQR